MKPTQQLPRLNHPSLEYEIKQGYPRLLIVGVDEVGRGCLAGPVVACAVVLPSQILWEQTPWLGEIKDSKLLSPESRERLSPLLTAWVRAFHIAQASVEEIDRLNIHYASHLAMERAVVGLELPEIHHILVDGKFIPRNLPAPASALIKGDQKSLSIACASVIAKVWRDHHMVELDAKFPGYGLAKHKGYPTQMHQAALRQRGITELHRRTFGPVAECI